MSDTQTESAAEHAADATIERAVHNALEAAGVTPAPRKDYAAIVAAWVNDEVMNTPIALSAEGYNHLTTVALPGLLKRLAAV